MGLHHGRLDILRIVIGPANDNHVLQASGEIELLPIEETEIAGTQIARPISASDLRLEGLPGGLRTPPVALAHAGAGDPDLTDLAGRRLAARLRIDDAQRLLRQGLPAADQHHGVVALRARRHHPPLLQVAAAHRADSGRAPADPAGDCSRVLRHPIGGIEGLGAEAAGSKSGGEAFEGSMAHGFSTVEGQIPRAQVQGGPLLLCGSSHAELIGEVGAAAGRRAVVRECLQPAIGVLNKSLGWHQNGGYTPEDRMQHTEQQPEVVEEGQPGDDSSGRAVNEPLEAVKVM